MYMQIKKIYIFASSHGLTSVSKHASIPALGAQWDKILECDICASLLTSRQCYVQTRLQLHSLVQFVQVQGVGVPCSPAWK